jgi:hypothetical protein
LSNAGFIAVDPGHSTGVAIFEGTSLLRTLTTTAPHAGLRDLIKGCTVVCERGPKNRKQADTCSDVEAIVNEVALDVVWVRPSDWKGHPATRQAEASLPVHERDAASIGYWFIALYELAKDRVANTA